MELSVKLEEQEEDGFETIDTITIPIDMCSFSNPPQSYDGVYNIASIELGYQVSLTPEDYDRHCSGTSAFHSLFLCNEVVF